MTISNTDENLLFSSHSLHASYNREISSTKIKRTLEDAEDQSSLPDHYNEDRLHLKIVNPYWAFYYWEVTDRLYQETLKSVPLDERENIGWFFLIIPISDELKPVQSFMKKIPPSPRSGYLHLSAPGISFEVELGLMGGNKKFIRMLRSNRIHFPADRPVKQMSAVLKSLASKLSSEGGVYPTDGPLNPFSSYKFQAGPGSHEFASKPRIARSEDQDK